MKRILILFMLAISITNAIGCSNTSSNIKEKTNETSTSSSNNTSKEQEKDNKANDNKKEVSNDSNTKNVDNIESSSKLGDDLFNKNFEIDNVVYTLPEKISHFVENGWTILDRDNKQSKPINPNATDLITLKKNKSLIYLYVENQTNDKLLPSECTVTGLQHMDHASLTLPKNIRIGSTKEQVDKAFDGIEKKVSEKPESIYYTYEQNKYLVIISIDTPTNRVRSISVSIAKF